MTIGGLQKFSLLDYPGHLSAIVFTQGCNFRCQFCYNPMLVWPDYASKSKYHAPPLSLGGGGAGKNHPRIKLDDFFAFLKGRQGKLEAVVISGGEPTMHDDLPDFIKQIKILGYLIKLDTNGTNPAMLNKLIKAKAIDYVAMDIKNSPLKYNQTTGVHPVRNFRRELNTADNSFSDNPASSEMGRDISNGVKSNLAKIKKSIKIIMGSRLPYEFRTTVVPGLIDKSDIKAMAKLIKGADKWFLQQFKSDTELVNDKLRNQAGYKDKELKELRRLARQYVKRCEIR